MMAPEAHLKIIVSILLALLIVTLWLASKYDK